MHYYSVITWVCIYPSEPRNFLFWKLQTHCLVVFSETDNDSGHIHLQDMCSARRVFLAYWSVLVCSSGRCEPVCHQGCIYGMCVQPDVCQCFFGWVGDNCSVECQCHKHSNCVSVAKRDECIQCENNTMVSAPRLHPLVSLVHMTPVVTSVLVGWCFQQLGSMHHALHSEGYLPKTDHLCCRIEWRLYVHVCVCVCVVKCGG